MDVINIQEHSDIFNEQRPLEIIDELNGRQILFAKPQGPLN